MTVLLLLSPLFLTGPPFVQATFIPSIPPRNRNAIANNWWKQHDRIFQPIIQQRLSSHEPSPTSLQMAGFGSSGGGGGKKKRKKKSVASSSSGGGGATARLRPKQQWDRFSDLKKEDIVRVAVRIVRDESKGDWLEVGHVKSKGNQYTELAVFLQRGLIADHSRRLFPLKIAANNKDKLEWGYIASKDSGNIDGDGRSGDENEYVDDASTSSSPDDVVAEDETWNTIDKNRVLTNNQELPENIERMIGFEGRPDPGSGYYCHYENGRIVP